MADPSLLSTFLANLFLSFAAMLLIAGAFGAYYGKGKSRSIGIVSMLVSVILLGVFCALTWPLVSGVAPVFDSYQVFLSMVAVGSALLGAIIAAFLYVIVVMRS